MIKGKVVFAVAMLLIALSGFLSTASALASTDWPMFRHDLTHSGSTDSNSTANSAQLLWSFPTNAAVLSSPAVADGYVIVGCKDCHIYCLNASTGKLAWSFATGNEVDSSPAISDGLAIVGCDDGWVYCMNISTGQPVWIVKAGGLVRSSPAVANNRVFIGSGLHDLYCFNVSTGDTLWTFPTKLSVDSSPSVLDGVVYFATDDFYLYALNASTGKEIWRQFTGSNMDSPCITDGYIYIGAYVGNFTCVRASDGSKVWVYQTQDTVASAAAAAYGRVYVGSEDGNIYCLNAFTGAKLWQTKTGYWVYSSPTIANGNVYVGSEDYNIYCLNASSGAIKWRYATTNIVESSPCVVGDVLYVGSGDYHLYALKLNDTAAVAPDPAVQVDWTTVVFDVLMASAWMAALLIIVRFLYLNKKNGDPNTTRAANPQEPWYSAHLNQIVTASILVFAVVCFLSLNTGPLWSADEKTYSQMAYHMIKSGDYLLPSSFGEPAIWAGKPPLLMWLMSTAYQAFGYSNFASRVWMPLFGVASLVVVYFLGKKLYNRWVGALSVLVLGTFSIFYSFSTHAMTDGPLLFFTLASIYFLLASEDSKHPYKCIAVSGLFFGLALMTKQIEALLIPLILIVYLAATRKSIRFLFTKWFMLFWGVGAAIFVPYVVYMTQRFRDFWGCYFVYSDYTRIISPIEGHQGSYLFYINYLITNEPVWAVFLPFAAALCIYNVAVKHNKSDMLILSWVVIVLAIFSFAETKLYWYILPAVPAFAVAIANLIYTASIKVKQHTKLEKA